jgi:hypothetical protein
MHVGVIAALFLLKPSAPPPMPPMYRVNIVAAPPGPRAAGVVRPREAPAPPPGNAAPPPKRAATNEKALPRPPNAPPNR